MLTYWNATLHWRMCRGVSADADGRSAPSRLDTLDITLADEIRIKQICGVARAPLDLEPESVVAHAIPGRDNKLLLTKGRGNRYGRSSLEVFFNVLSPETEASSLSAPLMSVLSARSLPQAQDLLDDLGYAPP